MKTILNGESLPFMPEPQAQRGPEPLTAREEEVWHWIGEGKSNGDIGRILGCAEETVKKHARNIYRKRGLENRTSAIAAYFREHAATPDGNDPPKIPQAPEPPPETNLPGLWC